MSEQLSFADTEPVDAPQQQLPQNRPLADAQARERITSETSATLFVDAGAGSGKTKSLVDRLVSIVVRDGIPLTGVAAVTFTEKAAAELRDRLRGKFESLTRDPELSAAGRERADAALDDIDAAAVGTLHSFARRVLSAYPIEAGLPPIIEVLDEVGSQVAFEDRWTALRADLLDDDSIRGSLLLALESGITLEHLRSLAISFDSDWDRLGADVLTGAIPADPDPDVSGIVGMLEGLRTRTGFCTNSDDKLLKALDLIDDYREQLPLEDPVTRIASLGRLADAKGLKGGQKNNWTQVGVDVVRTECEQLLAAARSLHQQSVDVVVRRLAYRIAEATLAGARQRQRSGELEFHDLLVLSRDLLRAPEHGHVRQQLHDEYQRILLDEFQDTDPIQIEVAVRIATDDPSSGDWERMPIPPGRLFVVGDPKQSIYRFRRADIATYLRAQEVLGDTVALTTNFRSSPAVLNWVNDVFGSLIVASLASQPDYQALDIFRSGPPAQNGPGQKGHVAGGVTVLGADPHSNATADDLRSAEAADVAHSIRTAINESWLVCDSGSPGGWRPVTLPDIAILIPARTSLPYLEAALDEAGIAYQADASSLVYQTSEVRELLLAAQAINDPSDELALVSTLRSTMFGCGDDDLWTWKHAKGSFNLLAAAPEGAAADHRVGNAIAYLRGLHDEARWQSPSELLDRLVRDRRMMELGLAAHRPRDIWRRLRFVIDQARAWAETEHGGLRAYLAWAHRQADESARVSEALLPETDSHAVRIMTVHSAKGLEFPMVIVSGMSSRPRNSGGVEVLWPRGGGFEIKLSKTMQTGDFLAAKPVDEQMDFHERIRLLYVACTRAQDHLVVSLHRTEPKANTEAPRMTNSQLLAGAAGTAHHRKLTRPRSTPGALAPQQSAPGTAPSYEQWHDFAGAAQANAAARSSVSASSLENLLPDDWQALEGFDVSVSDEAAASEVRETAAGLSKDQRDLESPPWNKGRYGSAIGRAVHAVLQTIDLRTGAGLDGAVSAQALAEGVLGQEELIASLARSAIGSDVIARAAAREHWREIYVGTELESGTILEGFIDLVYRDDDGALVVVDYKTDAVPDAAIDVRARVYLPQMAAYCAAVERATGQRVDRAELIFVRPDGALTRTVTSRTWTDAMTAVLTLAN